MNWSFVSGKLKKALCCGKGAKVSDVSLILQEKKVEEVKEDIHITVPYEVAVTWQQSLENLLSTADGRQEFTAYLNIEYSANNLQFYEAVSDFQRETNEAKIFEKAHVIFEDFVSTASTMQVNLSSAVYQAVTAAMVAPTVTTFNDAQRAIYTLMEKDSYKRYIGSQAYRRLLEDGKVEEL